MKKIAHTMLAFSILCLSGGLMGLFFASMAFVVVGEHHAVAAAYMIAAGVFFLGILLGLAGWCLDCVAEELRDERARSMKHPLLTFDPHEKEPGYNRAVLGWFHEGPELRQPNDDFNRAFSARSLVPPPVKKP